MDKDLLEELQGKISFVYELDGKLYAIGHNKIFDCKYSKIVAPDFISIYSNYQESIKCCDDKLDKKEIGKILFKLITYSCNEVKNEDNNEHIISIKDFCEKLTGDDRKIIKKQIDEFVYMFKVTGMQSLYPSIGK